MIVNFNIKTILVKFLLIVSLFAYFLSIQNSYSSAEYGPGRIRSCDKDGITEDIEYDPSTGGKDIEFSLSNPVCITVITTTYAAVKTAITTMNVLCEHNTSIRLTPSPIQDLYDIAWCSRHLAQNKERLLAKCGPAIAAASTAVSTAWVELAIIHDLAQHAFKNTTICGSNWIKANPKKYNFSGDGRKKEVTDYINDSLKKGDSKNLDHNSKEYREWYYDGVEFEDNKDDDDCLDATDVAYKEAHGNYPKQKYYLRGLEPGNFNCKKYFFRNGQSLPNGANKSDLDKAYKCCIERSSKYICIKYGDSYKFCRPGQECILDYQGLRVTFSASFFDNDRMICAESYSLCPYNFTIGGGTKHCDYFKDGVWHKEKERFVFITPEEVEKKQCAPTDTGGSEIRNNDCTLNEKSGKCKNYCQIFTHCTIIGNQEYQYNSEIRSPYFSDACLNFVGDSQNKVSFGKDSLIGAQKHFSAPIAQCMKETIENLFYNRFGYTRCRDVLEAPLADGSCRSGDYMTNGGFIYRKGFPVSEKSFFTTIQERLQLLVKLVLTFSIMFYGVNILIGKSSLGNKKEVISYIIKIGVVLFFATENAWQSMFFNSLYGTSTELSMMVFKIENGKDDSKRDGCQFGKITLSDGTIMDTGRNYPEGKEYLAIWDTLDCKIMRYLGFGPEASVANITLIAIAALFTGPIGIYITFSFLTFGILFILVTLRALHIFLTSAIAIVLSVFMSPIVFPAMLFAKTKNIFDSWLKNLIGYILQPVILFAYVAIFIIIIDRTLIGGAKFSGNGPHRTIDCSTSCKNADGSIVPEEDGKDPPCDKKGQYIYDPLDDSVACIIRVDEFAKNGSFQAIGISLPMVEVLFKGNVKQRIKTLLKGALMMYIIFKFMDEVPGIATTLVGGKLPDADKFNVNAILKKIKGLTQEFQKRQSRMMGKIGKNSVSSAYEALKKFNSKDNDAKESDNQGDDSHGIQDAQNEDKNQIQASSQNEDQNQIQESSQNQNQIQNSNNNP